MCGTEQSKIAGDTEAGFFDNMWSSFSRTEKYDREQMGKINPDGKALKEKSSWSFSSLFDGSLTKDWFGVKSESDKMDAAGSTYTPQVFKGYVKEIVSKEVS